MKDKLFTVIFFLSVFLIKIPPFYFTPFPIKLLTSYTIAKIFIVIILLCIIKSGWLLKKNFQRKLFIILCIYFISQTISILAATDTLLFLKAYQNTLMAIVLFITSYYFAFRLTNKKIGYFILFTGVVILLMELFFVLFNNIAMSIFQNILQAEIYSAYFINIERGRFHMDLNIELFLPFFLLEIDFSKKNKLLKVLSVISFFLIIFVGIYSNFRRRLLSIIFATTVFFFVFFIKKQYKIEKKGSFIVFIISFLMIVAIFSSLFFSNLSFSFNIIDRVMLTSDISDTSSIIFRTNAIKNTLNITKTHPLFGIGLGNYALYNKDYNHTTAIYRTLSSTQKQFAESGFDNAHNVFAQTLSETGLFGLISYSLLIIAFVYKDVLFVFSHSISTIHRCMIIAFWLLFIYGLFSPFDTLFKNSWFWFLRGLIEGKYFRLQQTS